MPLVMFLIGLSACSGGSGGNSADANSADSPGKAVSAQSRQPQAQGGGGSGVPVPDWSKDAVMYEVNVRQYTKEGTFAAFAEHLPRLKELGVDILWFMPIYPISKTNRNGGLGSYYAVDDYKAVNAEFGASEDFKALVDEAHEMGFKVMLDWVANHTGWDNAWTANAGWYTTDEAGSIVMPPGTDWADVADLNYENQDMQAAMIDAMTYWVKEFDIDGYRADYASGVPKAFWEEARVELEQVKPVYMLAEDDQQIGLLQHAFNSNYGWSLYNMMNRIAKGHGNALQVKSYGERLVKSYPAGTYPLNFTSNHDENSWTGTVHERLGEGVKTMAALSFLMPGMPLIYSGQEAGLDKRLLFFDKDEINWSDLSMQSFYKRLIALKHDNPALWNGSAGGDFHSLETGDDRLLAFERTKDGNTVIAVLNLSGDSVTSEVAIGEELAGEYHRYADGGAPGGAAGSDGAVGGAGKEIVGSTPDESLVTVEGAQSLELAPWEFEWYTIQK